MKLQLIILILSAIPTILLGQKSWEAFETNKVSQLR